MANSKTPKDRVFKDFDEFFPFYLQEHSNLVNRRLHVAGTSMGVLLFTYLLATRQYNFMPVSLVCGYGFAWIGHFFFEKNKPATFKYPVYSFMGDMRMLYGVFRGEIEI